MSFNEGFFVQQNTSAPSYLVYTALLTQTSTNAPVATVLENTLGATPVWSYDSVGFYIATLTGAFIVGKTVVFMGTTNLHGDGIIVNDVNNVNEIWVNSAVLTAGFLIDTDELLFNTPIEIRVYP